MVTVLVVQESGGCDRLLICAKPGMATDRFTNCYKESVKPVGLLRRTYRIHPFCRRNLDHQRMLMPHVPEGARAYGSSSRAHVRETIPKSHLTDGSVLCIL